MKTPWLQVILLSLCSWGALPELHGAPLRVTGLTWAESAALSPDGRLLWIGHLNGAVTCIDAASGTVLRRWPASGNNQVEQLSFSADGSRVLTVSPNRVLRVLSLDQSISGDLAKWSWQEYYPGGALSPDGKHALAVAHQGPLRWCAVASGQTLREWTDTAGQKQGYSSAVVLTNDGLAVVAPLQGGTAALIDAAKGEVLARLTGGIGRIEWLAREQCVAWGGQTWSYQQLVEARQTRPSELIKGYDPGLSLGWLGQAMRRSLPSDQWIFWVKSGAEKNRAAWLEPSWPQLRSIDNPRRGRGPVVVDWKHHRIWWQEDDGIWAGWDMGELGKPDGLSIGGYPSGLSMLKGGLLMAGDVNGMQAFVQPQNMKPLASSQSHVSTDSRDAKRGTLVDRQWDPKSGWREGWAQVERAAGWRVQWTDENGTVLFAQFSGNTGQPPRFVHGPAGATAMIFSRSYMEDVGATQLQRSALRLWDNQEKRWLPARFEDHREVEVREVRWSPTGRWLGSSNFIERDGPKTVRVWSVPEGRRLGQPVEGVAGWAVGKDGALAWTDRDGQIYLRYSDGKTTRRISAPDALLRSARVALSSDETHVALLTGDNILLVKSVRDGKEVYRESLAWWPQAGWEPPSGDLIYIGEQTLAVLTSRNAWLRLVKY